MTYPWTFSRIEQLAELIAKGKSAKQIAAIMGTTRNSVIGKAKRVGIDWPVSSRIRKTKLETMPSAMLAERQRRDDEIATAIEAGLTERKIRDTLKAGQERIRRVANERSLIVAKAPKAAPRKPKQPPAIKPEPEYEPQTLNWQPVPDAVYSHHSKQCHWIFGDPKRGAEIAYCTRKHLPGAVYCQEHYDRSYRLREVL